MDVCDQTDPTDGCGWTAWNGFGTVQKRPERIGTVQNVQNGPDEPERSDTEELLRTVMRLNCSKLLGRTDAELLGMVGTDGCGRTECMASRYYACACRRAGPRGSRTRKRWVSGSRSSLVQLHRSWYKPGLFRFVEYQCIMDVFTLSSLSAQVRAICVISIKGSCPKWVTI